MIKHIQQTACALTVLATTSLPALAESVDVRVIGTITPAACTPVLSGGGTIDYGSIHPTSLSSTAYTVLPVKSVDFAITCDAPAKIAVKAMNGRVGTAAGVNDTVNGAIAPSGVTLFGITNAAVVGLGLDGAAKIGGYAVQITPSTYSADGTAVDGIYRNNPTDAAWGLSVSGNIYAGGAFNRQISWANSGTTVPTAFTSIAGKLAVQAYLNHASELDLTKPVTLDGLTTIELVYL